MSERVFGSADDFYRIRIIRVDMPDELELEWHDDILWREVPADLQGSLPRFKVEAVLKDTNAASVIAELEDPAAAREAAMAADEDLTQLTKRQFDARYGIEG